MKKEIIFWIFVLLIFAVVMSIVFRPKIEVEPTSVEVFVNDPTARDELLRVRENQTKEVPFVETISINITTAGTENIQVLKEAKRIEIDNWSYYYHPNNSACYAKCNLNICTVNEYWCGINESIYFDNLTK